MNGNGVALRGRLLLARPGEARGPDGLVLVDAAGRVTAVGALGEVRVPPGTEVVGDATCTVLPGLVDAHVHHAFGAPAQMLARGVVATRDLGSPVLRRGDIPAPPAVAVAGPLLTAPGGYPSTSWGAGGFARFVAGPEEAADAVRELATQVDVVKLALEPGMAGDLPVPDLRTAEAVVRAAHTSGLAVTAHALTVAMVRRALDARVDELCHVPLEPLPADVVTELARRRLPVVSTLHTHAGTGAALGNAAALVAAGVPLVYGTDLGNAGTAPGADPAELRLLADAGLGALGALRAATSGAASVAGLEGFRGIGRIAVGEPAAVLVVPGDPLEDVALLRRPVAVVTGAPSGGGTRLQVHHGAAH